MLSDDLPQLLQRLLIGVEHSIERLSLNQLSAPYNQNVDSEQKPQTLANKTLADQKNNSAPPGSPKCILRRSELITKNNKLHNNKYMLRRFTNRQDSMNSTSSGNSSASGLSTASSSSSNSSYTKGHLNHGNHASNNNNNNHRVCNGHKNNNNSKQCETDNQPNDSNTSPALPRFCLGKSFPHIDSDEENAEERRNSLTDGELKTISFPSTLHIDIKSNTKVRHSLELMTFVLKGTKN